MRHIEFQLDRDANTPIVLEEMVAEDSWARVVDAFVEALPMEKLGFAHAVCQTEGRPPYHPRVLLKLLLFGYSKGLRSSSKLYYACQTNIEVWWLLRGLKPSERKIC